MGVTMDGKTTIHEAAGIAATTSLFSFLNAEGETALAVSLHAPTARLKRVVDDRFGTVFDPPKEHLGAAVEADPLTVGELALAYLESLVDEASTLCP
jgi:hypothetical protein